MYKHPIPVVRVILENSDSGVLILKRANEQYANNRWCLPGGKVDYGQNLESACVNELSEETNLEISDLKFLFYRDYLPSEVGMLQYIDFYFSAKYSGKLSLNEESSDVVWVKPFEILEYDIAFGNGQAIEDYLAKK